jgi:hypothetical protein
MELISDPVQLTDMPVQYLRGVAESFLSLREVVLVVVVEGLANKILSLSVTARSALVIVL